MPKLTQIDVELTDKALELFSGFLSRITDYKPTLCLMKGRWRDEPDEHWCYGSYAPENIEALGPIFENNGYCLLYEISGMVLAISTPDKVSELVGKTIDVGEKGLVIKDRNNDI
jgi:hypothetical protein